MTTKVVRILKQGSFTLLLIISLISCEGSIDEVGVNVVDKKIFETSTHQSDVVAYNQNITRRKANALGQYLLGVYKNNDIGQIDATIISQLTFNTAIDFGVDPVIDTVIVDIPYQSTLQDDTNDDGSSIFELDSIYGNQAEQFKLNIYELDTYLNTLDPSDPSQTLDYYTDDEYDFSTELYSGLFTPNKNDTALYVKRPGIIADEENGIYKVDTIKNTNAAPSIKFPLEEDFFTNNFFTNPAAFQSPAAFADFFKGLYIEASEYAAPESSIMSLDLSNATMTLYYTNSVLTDETITSTDSEGVVTIVSQTDLNNDGDFDDVDVPVRTKQTISFLFGSVVNNKYTRDYTGSLAEPVLDNPDDVLGDEQLFIHGAAGSIVLIDLFVDEDIEELRSNNWLINNAALSFYIDQSADKSILPNRLFLYNYETNQQLPDMIFEGSNTFGGFLELDDEDNPYRYTVNITDYISRVLDPNEPLDLSKLAVKIFNSSDFPSGILDVEVDDYSWNPKGIIIHGNQSSATEKRIKLEITYSEINQ